MSLRDLFVRFKIDVDGADTLAAADKKIRAAKTSAQSLGQELRTIGRLFVTGWLARGIKTFVEDLIKQGDALKHQASALGITTDELQKYKYAAALMQVPVEQTAFALRFFNRAVGEASFGTKSAVKVFGQLGVSIKDTHGNVKPTADLLFEVADKLKGVKSQAERTAIAMRLLGRGGAAMLPVLQNGSAALREMFKDIEELGGGFDEAFIEKAHEVDRQQKRLAMGWRTMAAELGKQLLPMIGKWIEHQIKNIKVMIDYAKHTNGIRHALQFLPIVLGAVTAGILIMNAALLPEIAAWGVLGGVLTGIYLIFDDLATFLSGGDSLLGRMLDQIGGRGAARAALADIKAAFKAIGDALKLGSDSAGTLGAALAGIFVRSIPSIIKWSGTFAIAVTDAIALAIAKAEQLQNLLNGTFRFKDNVLFSGDALAAVQAQNKEIQDAYDALHAKLQAGARALDDLTTPIGNASRERQDIGPVGITSGNASYSMSQPLSSAPPLTGSSAPIINNNITIHGNADPRQVQDAASKGTTSALKTQQSTNRDTYDSVGAGQPWDGPSP